MAIAKNSSLARQIADKTAELNKQKSVMIGEKEKLDALNTELRGLKSQRKVGK